MKKTIKKIRVYGDPFLGKKAVPVENLDDDLIDFSEVLTRTMIEFDGLGLASTQVGTRLRLIALGVPVLKDGNGVPAMTTPGEFLLLNRMPLVLVNPEIISSSAETVEREEGCLSVPEIFAKVVRPAKVTIRAQILGGESFTAECGGLLGRAFQHEIDHLDGILFVDRLSEEEHEKIAPQLDKMKKRYARLNFLRKLISKKKDE